MNTQFNSTKFYWRGLTGFGYCSLSIACSCQLISVPIFHCEFTVACHTFKLCCVLLWPVVPFPHVYMGRWTSYLSFLWLSFCKLRWPKWPKYLSGREKRKTQAWSVWSDWTQKKWRKRSQQEISSKCSIINVKSQFYARAVQACPKFTLINDQLISLRKN